MCAVLGAIISSIYILGRRSIVLAIREIINSISDFGIPLGFIEPLIEGSSKKTRKGSNSNAVLWGNVNRSNMASFSASVACESKDSFRPISEYSNICVTWY